MVRGNRRFVSESRPGGFRASTNINAQIPANSIFDHILNHPNALVLCKVDNLGEEARLRIMAGSLGIDKILKWFVLNDRSK